jgi:hypothetical protein
MNETRETITADVYPALSRSVEDIAAGWADEPIFVHKTFAQNANVLCKKIKTYHAAAGDSAVYRVKRPV